VSDDRAVEAAKIVANRAMANALRREFIDEPDRQWELYPEVGEYDWDVVLDQVAATIAALDPSKDTFDAAYGHLGARADAE